MADADRTPPAAVTIAAVLAATPHVVGFYQAMRRLEALHRNQPRLGRSVRPDQDALRLAQDASSIFAPATLATYTTSDAGKPPRLAVNFLGLFGPDGPLPLPLTDYARDRLRNARDASFQHFADLFHHRALSLFWRAYANVRPTLSFDRPEDDRFALYVGALIGLGMDSLRERDAMPDLSKLHFAGRLANQTRHAEGLAEIVASFFEVPARLDCFIGSWLALPAQDVTRLDASPERSALGQSSLIGGRVWSRQHKFRIVFGPLGLDDYERLLPGGDSFARLIPIVRNYAGDVLMWDVNLVLRADAIPQTRLGRSGQLGWTTWLGPRRDTRDAADLCLDASAGSHARITADRPSPQPEVART